MCVVHVVEAELSTWFYLYIPCCHITHWHMGFCGDLAKIKEVVEVERAVVMVETEIVGTEGRGGGV